jgi:type VI secretion system protein ImpH
MATPSGGPATPVNGGGGALSAPGAQPARRTPGDRTLEEWLFEEGYAFDFFQAVRLLEQLDAARAPVGRAGAPEAEAVRFHARLSLDFPPSTIYEVKRPSAELPLPSLTAAFMGMTGPSGVLPRHYTEQLMRLEREAKGAEKRALRAWLDLFNHRFISLFHRAWDKYRFFLAFERGEYNRREPDPFTLGLLSLIGLGTPALRNRLHIVRRDVGQAFQPDVGATFDAHPTIRRAGKPDLPGLLGRIDDLALLRYAGFFAHRPRNAVSLQRLLSAFLKLPVQVVQFQGQWLKLDPSNCTALGPPGAAGLGRGAGLGGAGLGGGKGGANNALGRDVVVGDRVWDVQSKIRVRLGPLTYAQFQDFLPDYAPQPQRKGLFLLSQLVRLYVGPELDVEFQLVLQKEEVPSCTLGAPAAGAPAAGAPATGMASRLGWNTWSKKKPKIRDAEEAVFQARDLVREFGAAIA